MGYDHRVAHRSCRDDSADGGAVVLVRDDFSYGMVAGSGRPALPIQSRASFA